MIRKKLLLVLNILISILCGAKSEISICASLVVGFIIGTLLSLSANFVFYLLPINKIMTFYNFINKYYVVDGNLITGKGPMATIDFALGFVQLLVGSDISESIKKGSFYYNR